MGWSDYFYDGTDVLVNKLDIRDAQALNTVEHELAARRQAEIEQGHVVIDKTFDANHLHAIHFHLFGDLYQWAGRKRDVEISKVSQFAPVDRIDNAIGSAAAIIAETDWDRIEHDEFCDRAAATYAWLNWAHCHREGNGRTVRIFMTDVAALAGRCLDYGAIRREVFVQRAAFSCPDLSQREPDWGWMVPVFQQIVRPAGDLTISTDFRPQQRDTGAYDLGM